MLQSPARNLSSPYAEILPLDFHLRSFTSSPPQPSEQQFTSQEPLKLPGKGCNQEVPNQGLPKRVWPHVHPRLSYSLLGCATPPAQTRPTVQSPTQKVDCRVMPDTLSSLTRFPHGVFFVFRSLFSLGSCCPSHTHFGHLRPNQPWAQLERSKSVPVTKQRLGSATRCPVSHSQASAKYTRSF